jgi:RNA polymerase sigma factor (sigma-70 family)
MPGRPFRGVIAYLRRVNEAPAPGTAGDSHLVERFVRQRDETAFAELVRRHGPMVLSVCRRVLRHEQDAEDAFQATFLVLARKAASIRARASVGGWLYGVAQRVAFKARSAAARRRQQERQPAAAAAPPDPAGEAARSELRPVLAEELGRLPEKYRAPVVLCYLEGRTNEEAARALGWTKGTVSGRLARARDLLRGRLARRGLALTGAALAAALAEEAPAAVPNLVSQTTARAAALGAAGPVSPAVVALTEGVLRAMFLSKLRTYGVVMLSLLMIGIPAGVLAYHALADEPKEPKKEPPPAARASDALEELLKQRAEVAREGLKVARQEFQAGVGTGEALAVWSRKVAEAELDRGNRQAGLAALEDHVARVKEWEKVTQARFDAGRVSPQDLAAARYARLDAEIWLARVKAKK